MIEKTEKSGRPKATRSDHLKYQGPARIPQYRLWAVKRLTRMFRDGTPEMEVAAFRRRLRNYGLEV